MGRDERWLSQQHRLSAWFPSSMCTQKHDSAGLFLRWSEGLDHRGFPGCCPAPSWTDRRRKSRMGGRVGKGGSSRLNVISGYFNLIIGTFPPWTSRKNLDLVPEVKGEVGQEKQGAKAMWIAPQQPLSLGLAEVNLNISFYSLSIYWVLWVVALFAADQIPKAPHCHDQLWETKQYRDVCPFEMQITLRKVIKIATAFVKIRRLSPCPLSPI